MAQEHPSTEHTTAQPAPAPRPSRSSGSSAPTKPLGFVDEDQAAYAEARNELKNKERQEAEKTDPFEEGKKRAEQRAETAAETNEVQVEEGGSLAANDLMAGNIKETINQPSGGVPKDNTRLARLMIRAAKAMQSHAGLATLLPTADTWGLVGQGDELNGHYVLIDLDSLAKVVVTERWVINEDRIFANSQQWPKALMQGDTLEKAAAA